jgi:hypothetical protein
MFYMSLLCVFAMLMLYSVIIIGCLRQTEW